MNSVIASWQTGVGEIQFIFAIGLFFIINFIGSKTYSIGYMPISLLAKDDSKLAFNFALIVAAPIVYLIVLSSLLYYLKLDFFVNKFYLVSVYYLFFRYLINALEGRLRLLNWGRQAVYSLSIVFLSYFFYDKFISIKKNLLPDFSNLANEMWIIIMLFIYKIVNELAVSAEGAEKRKSNYVYAKYLLFKNRYGKIINSQLDNDVLKAIVYAIIIYENFNRSRLVRTVENISYLISKKPHTLGVMQVLTDKFIDDERSVVLGIKKVKQDYADYLFRMKQSPWGIYASDDPEYRTGVARREIISKYNTGDEYASEVDGIAEKIVSKFYPRTKDVLDPISQSPESV